MSDTYRFYDTNLLQSLEERYGIDLSFDARFGVKDTKDVVVNDDNTDFQYVAGPLALAEELQRLFDLTPRGSVIDDPSYGIDLDFIGQPNDPRITTGLAKVACVQALQHPSFASRFQIEALDVTWSPDEPTVLRINGLLRLFGFDGLDLVRFGPYVLRYLLNQ